MKRLWIPAAMAAALACGAAQADTGKLVLTGGVSSIDGAAGGGLTPWAVIGTQATDGELGVSVHATRTSTHDYGFTTYGAAIAWNNRVEASLARQDLGAGVATALNGIAPFGVAPDAHVRMDIVGLKVRVLGEAVLDADTWMPQVAAGLQAKHTQPGSLGSVLDFLGTRRSGIDLYASATKLLLGPGVLVNATLRSTNANQNGLLGFGSAAPGRDSRSLRPELSVAYLAARNVAIGTEVRFKPNNLEPLGRAAGLGNALREDAWKDVFVAWAPLKNLSLTAAYVDLGRIVPGITANRSQRGAYLSAQAAF